MIQYNIGEREFSIVELDHGYVVCGLKTFKIMDTNDMRYVNCACVRVYACMYGSHTDIQTKFSCSPN